ncbi:sensor histidine kinase [Paenibacillus sp. sptzw28]|uniref:sensor histidine kinase n=1 Tax=Paenibacillus sp. sptzw28 TaxID=715179 RepID=UPI001C6E16F2|nr:sensor histidine kinase [Paenibacillus sp. sptzw28]QYR22391.1 sensor histidine kinase [Paenibacillus sp. sptzw28]
MKLLRWISSSLRAKLLTMFVILTCVPLIAVGLISYQKSFNTVFGNSKASAILVAGQLARDIDTLFMDTGKLLELGKNPQVLHFLFSQSDTYEDAKEILRTMDSYRQTYKYDSVLNITMINLYGRGISERRGVFQLDRNPLRNPHFSYLVNHPDAILNIPPSDSMTMDRLDGFQYDKQHVISIMATVRQRITHEVIGFIVIDLDDSIVKRFCDNVTIGRTGFFYVADNTGAPIFTPANMDESSTLLKPADLTAMTAGSSASFVDSSAGKPKFVVASASLATGWKIVGLAPLQEIVREANSIRQLIIISVALSIVFAITLHFFITARLTRPVQLLKNKMQLAASGYLEAKVTPEGKDEIADLGSSFNIMLGKIKALLSQSIKEQEEIQKAELRALQAQINPHFLYNTLDSIVWMAEAGKNDKVIRLVQSLSRLFRISLSRGRDWISLERELEHVGSYLEIQQMRYRDILDYEVDVDPQLHSFPILKMTLQPIVENALYHGLKNKRGKGFIRISGYEGGEREIVLTVRDTGIGMSPGKLEQLRVNLSNRHIPAETGKEVSGGFGLHNVHQRIRLYYGEGYGVQVDSMEREGTTVTIRIPMRLE